METIGLEEKTRCPWAYGGPLYIDYHDNEWGVPVHDDIKLFEFMILESAQAGLSWITILRKRENYRRAFADFDPEAVSRYGERDIERLMNDPGIVRNRRKITAAINNSAAFLKVREEFGSFDSYIWSFTGGKPVTNYWTGQNEVPAVTEKAVEISKDLKKRGFSFLGPTIVYAHMQATGLVNDHLVSCFRHAEISKML
ncbi:MAG: DNA-3-methyladenine glycosylase I [Mesotoga sp.]|uniref:DNA-3-methyladenine glycosylase I n=1 Tax=Mesotoga infera TaxID=1236046 RepID=A0A7Z7LF60_9BACT|nr:DNA-3-methyladenine glycosylase I [Mesotoga sp.]SSC12870.1 3-methyl-adenine DNA glycosylase I, constitutive [Mesotoga infera]HON28184.1 DNA-3-methyladenine glycosylase I [Mesotoga infera]